MKRYIQRLRNWWFSPILSAIRTEAKAVHATETRCLDALLRIERDYVINGELHKKETANRERASAAQLKLSEARTLLLAYTFNEEDREIIVTACAALQDAALLLGECLR